MAQPYIGEIRMFAGNFAPDGWMFCSGQLLPISEYETLFQLIGTTYGGDGQSTFALPDLRGRIPIHQGNSFVLAETGGIENVQLTAQQIPSHTHTMVGTSDVGTASLSQAGVLARTSSFDGYTQETSGGLTPLSSLSLPPVGGGQPHENMMPFLCFQFIISLFGIFPSPT
ncbi:MAG: tail fiber protein [Saprospiraceae bacterium]|jgi:microcystin-dependent protein|nr:tail fiber protein [Saprospiraceae bacterium]